MTTPEGAHKHRVGMAAVRSGERPRSTCEAIVAAISRGSPGLELGEAASCVRDDDSLDLSTWISGFHPKTGKFGLGGAKS